MVHALCSAYVPFCRRSRKGTPQEMPFPKRLFRTLEALDKECEERSLHRVPKYAPFCLQKSKRIPPGTSTRRRKKCTLPPPEVNHLENFSGLKETFKAGGRYKNPIKFRRTVSTSSVAPFFSAKEKFLTGAGRCMLSFSQST